MIDCEKGGYNSGRKYCLQVTEALNDNLLLAGRKFSGLPEEATPAAQLAHIITRLADSANKRKRPKSLWLQSRIAAKTLFNDFTFQTIIAMILVANFITNAYEAQMYGKLGTKDNPTPALEVLNLLDLIFTAIFVAELLLNLHGHLFIEFVTNAWSIFDFLVVAVSLVTLFSSDDSQVPITVFRLLRAFRVLRLFGRLKAIKKIINALSASLIPVANAFMILGIVIMLYSIIAVTFFAESAPTDMGNLSRAIISLFKIAGGDTWVGEGDPEDGLPVLREDGSVNWPVGVFVISYVLIINWTLLQVSVAVLLDNFVSETTRQQVIHRFVSYLSAEHV